MAFGALAPLPLRLGGSPEEGWTPEQHARFCADLVAVKRTMQLARLVVSQISGSPFTASVAYYSGQNGAGIINAPAALGNAAGDVSVTFPAFWEDEYERQFPVRVRQAIARPLSLSANYATCEIAGANEVRVRVFNDSGSAVAANFALRVW